MAILQLALYVEVDTVTGRMIWRLYDHTEAAFARYADGGPGSWSNETLAGVSALRKAIGLTIRSSDGPSVYTD